MIITKFSFLVHFSFVLLEPGTLFAWLGLKNWMFYYLLVLGLFFNKLVNKSIFWKFHAGGRRKTPKISTFFFQPLYFC
jgi:hypothetical protein